MAQLQNPQVVTNFLSGMQLGQQNRRERQADQDRNQLRNLTPNALSGDQDALAQMTAISPQHANQVQQAGDSQARRLRGAAKYMQQALQAGNPAQVQGAWQAVKPFLERATGKQGPDQWDPSYAQGLEQVLAQTAYLEGAGVGGNVQSTFVDENGNRVAIMRDGSTQILGRNNPNIRVLEQEGTLPYGVVTSGGPAGQVVPLGQGGQQQAQSGAPQQQALPPGGSQSVVDQIAASANQMIAAGVPPEQVEAWAQQQGGGGQVSQGLPPGPQASAPPPQAPQQGGQLPPPLDYQGGGQVGPVRTPTAGERAADMESAKLQQQLQYAPAMQQIETQGAIERERGVGQVRSETERQVAQTTKSLDAQNTIQLLDQAKPLLERATGSLVGSAADATAAAFGRTTEGAQATAALQTIAGQLIGKMPRFEGPQSDKDVLLYRQMAGDLANPRLPRETRLAALQEIRRLNEKAAGQGGGGTGGGQGRQPRRVQTADDYNSLPSGALYIAPDGTQRRKR